MAEHLDLDRLDLQVMSCDCAEPAPHTFDVKLGGGRIGWVLDGWVLQGGAGGREEVRLAGTVRGQLMLVPGTLSDAVAAVVVRAFEVAEGAVQ